MRFQGSPQVLGLCTVYPRGERVSVGNEISLPLVSRQSGVTKFVIEGSGKLRNQVQV
jgi:hypothetical protein